MRPTQFPALLALACALAGPSLAPAQERFSPFVGSQPEDVAAMVALAKLKPGETVLDLGSGDGRIVIAAASTHPGVRGWGVDIDSKLVTRARAYASMAGVAQRARFVHGDVFDADLAGADVIFMWLLPELQRLLRPRILAEARPGTRVVANMFDLGSWFADQTHPDRQYVKLWIVPAKVEGNWNWTLRENGVVQRYAAVIEQRFQHVEGVVRMYEKAGERRRELREFSLKGDRLSFWLSHALADNERTYREYSGVVRGERIEGRSRLMLPASTGGEDDGSYEMREVSSAPWTARRTPASAYFERREPVSGYAAPRARNRR
ncbi:MAG: class I SAM-dependent methyltransferase [Burkholderiales bacterium]|nr:class I SAM-dependent methyltransferase [Burkholderiales bacterium]